MGGTAQKKREKHGDCECKWYDMRVHVRGLVEFVVNLLKMAFPVIDYECLRLLPSYC